MADNTALNPSAGGGDIIATEDAGLGYKIPVSKIRIGASDIDGGDVTITNPFPISITDGYNAQVSVKGATIPASTSDHAMVIALSPNSPIPTGTNNIGIVTNKPASIASYSTVPLNISNVTLLSANSLRIGATIYNNSSAFLYIMLGSTATTSSFTAPINPGGYYEIPYHYNGVISGIWSSSVVGSALITELI